MLALALPAEDNWKHKHPSSTATGAMNRPPPSSLPSQVSARENSHGHLASTPMVAASSSNGTVVPSSAAPYGSPSKPLVRSKSRGGSVGGFVHGIVNNVQASLRNVGHKQAQSVPANGYHSDHPPPSKTTLFKSKSTVIPAAGESPESPMVSERSRDLLPTKAFNKQLARSTSRSRAYESEGDNHTIGSIRHSRPGFPPLSTSTDKVAKANGHTHVPLSPLSRESSQTPSISMITSAMARPNEHSIFPQSPSPSTPGQAPWYSMRGPVQRSAARAILELDAIPPAEVLKSLAMLLEQIASANDALRAERTARGEEPWEDQLMASPTKQEGDYTSSPISGEGFPTSPGASPTQSRSRSQQRAASDAGSTSSSAINAPIWNQLTNASRIALSSRTATLSFHARHIPQISLEAYLLRILKYCPTANATFVAVLVYFDRMCRMAADVEKERQSVLASGSAPSSPSKDAYPAAGPEKPDLSRRAPFAIDSYNVHRLVIAGVTVASKFFSDVFYTNSRYAKVGGLPQGELNALELQFLLLNDFALVIPPEELARYAAQLISYGQSKGIPLKPEGVGKGKLGKEAKIVLGLEPEPVPEPINSPSPYLNHGFGGMSPLSRGYNGMARSTGMNANGVNGGSRVPYQPGAYSHDNRSQSDGMDISHDSETEVSTDEDSTIKARSGSESEASEWGVGSTEDEGDGAETETEGDEEANDSFNDRNIRRPRSASSGSRGRRIRGVPSASMMEGRRP